MARFALKSNRVFVDGVLRPAQVVVDGELIEAVLDADAAFDGDCVDVGHKVVMPGLVDTHVHINEPGRTDWEGFKTATRAAIAGGVTTVVDMPLNCIPVTTTQEALQVKLAACRPSLYADTGFWGGVVPGNASEIEKLADDGILGAKAFMIDSGIPEFEWSDNDALRAGMLALKKKGCVLLAHCEVDLGAEIGNVNPQAYESFLESRPQSWEVEAISRLIGLCRETRCPIHIVHLSAAAALPLIRAAKREGLPLTVETCPHYLTIASEEIPDGATQYKCCPPIREASNRALLWQALEDGTIDMVTTDHSPCTPNLKLQERGDFHEAWGGISSLQLGLPLIWSTASDRGIALETVLGWMSATPAKIAGLDDRKGSIAPGKHADLVVFDPTARATVDAAQLQMKNKLTPYDGRIVTGVVEHTYLRGKRVFSEGEFAPPSGQPLLGRKTP
ncbi:MAG: allantoinase AllB [bacterium]